MRTQSTNSASERVSTETADSASRTESRTESRRWRLVKRFQTLESALALMKQLNDRGQASQLVMADGLSVIIR
ncbi:MAG: hypothetical protein O3B86_12335 [Planctomycetota bacterium]|nr:hypothetical protein [Planctomycetota bacterium]